MTPESFMIFTGTANTRLAVDVVNHLDMSLGKMTVGRFSDGCNGARDMAAGSNGPLALSEVFVCDGLPRHPLAQWLED